MDNDNNQLTTRSSLRNQRVTPDQSNDEMSTENVQRVHVREQCAEWRCTTTSWATDIQGNIHISAAFDQARLTPADLKNPSDLRSEDRVTWTTMRAVKPLYQQEAEARQSITKAPIRFVCLYCDSTFKKMKNCKEHVVGKKHPIENKWHIQCPVRKMCEGIPDDGFVPEGSYLPMMFPWAEFACVDADYEKDKEDFSIAPILLKNYDMYHIDMRQPQNCIHPPSD